MKILKNIRINKKYHLKTFTIMESKKKNENNLVDKYRRTAVNNLLTRRSFVMPSFEIYGGVAGLYDYGPPGCALKTNVENYWRDHFILEENLLEVGGVNLTPEPVLKASVNLTF